MEKNLQDTSYLGNSAILAKERGNRPAISSSDSAKCPFCLENKDLLEYIWLEKQVDDDSIRIVNNKYPICHVDQPVYGYHDVVIDTHHHLKTLCQFSIEHWYVLLTAMQEHIKKMAEDERIAFIQIFKNHGIKAGASIAHSHWQIVGLEKIPKGANRTDESNPFVQKAQDACMVCQLINHLDKE